MPTITEAASAAHTATLTEAASNTSVVLMKLIAPGWGSKAYYSEALLQQYGPVAFPAGTHTYWDHPTISETVDHPERTLTKLAGVTLEPARWEPNGAQGPGLYATAEVRSDYSQAVADMAGYVGCSIRAQMMVEQGEAEGRTGLIATEFLPSPFNSVDYVTVPGADGRIVQIFEAAGSVANTWRTEAADALHGWLTGTEATAVGPVLAVAAEAANMGHWLEARLHLAFTETADHLFGEGRLSREERMALSGAIGVALAAFSAHIETEAADLYARSPWSEPAASTVAAETTTPAEATVTTPTTPTTEAAAPAGPSTEQLQARLNVAEARDLARVALAATEALPAAAHQRVLDKVLGSQVPTTEAGELDTAAMGTAIDAAIKAEAEYLAAVMPSGVTGHGATTTTEAGTDLAARFAARFQSAGMSAAAAAKASA